LTSTVQHRAASLRGSGSTVVTTLTNEALGRTLGEFGDFTRARKVRRVPVVLTRAEVWVLLAELSGTPWLVASMLYGSGLRLMEALRLRVKDVVLDRAALVVRDGRRAAIPLDLVEGADALATQHVLDAQTGAFLGFRAVHRPGGRTAARGAFSGGFIICCNFHWFAHVQHCNVLLGNRLLG
jgi:integrase